MPELYMFLFFLCKLKMTEDSFVFNDTHSRLRYVPQEETDFGLVYCWAQNAMGVMKNPCIFQLIPAGRADCD